MKTVAFTIRFDGAAKGLTSHRLSLSTFKSTLVALIDAVQFTAELASKRDQEEFSHSTKAGPVGKSIDLEIESISDGCVTLNCLVTVAGSVDVIDTLDELRVDTAKSLIDYLRAESESTLPTRSGNPAVAKYLKSLPGGVTTQEYSASVDGTRVAYLTIPGRRVVPPSQVLPRLITVTGTVSSTAFRAGHERVVISTLVGKKKYTCSATQELVETALTLRGGRVTAMIVVRPDSGSGKSATLVSLRDASEPLRVPSEEERDTHLFTKWAGALELLAE